MKKALIIAGVIAALVALLWFYAVRHLNSTAVTAAAARWPNNLGTTADIARLFTSHGENETATRVAELSKPLASTSVRPVLSVYIAHAIGKENDDIDAPPAAVTTWLAEHGSEVRAIQQQLVVREPPQWAVDTDKLRDAPMPKLIDQMDLYRAFAVDALEHHRAGNDAVAWDDLHASWKLTQGLVARPELISQLIAVAGTRLSNGVAAKLSGPAPAWRHELATFDFGGAVIAAFSWEAVHRWRYLQEHPSGEPTSDPGRNEMRRFLAIGLAPLLRYRGGQALDAQREVATELASLRACDPHPRLPPMMPSVAEAWRRIGRFRAEVEGVEKLLALKAARAQSGTWPESMPSIAGSSCSDGSWQYQRAADGSMSLAFSRAIPVAKPQTTVVPLVFRYGK
ncbi:MAG: hypothetical protein QOI24_3104 [Acidobacteriota bacterium]|nr:hypothetical protein [Acidobacteriota bacterium]